MDRYRNLSGSSGVAAYEIGKDFIKVKFTEGSVYLYNYASAGPAAIERMKILARQGWGLSAYISEHVWEKYHSKLK